jgi:hypothetical protein
VTTRRDLIAAGLAVVAVAADRAVPADAAIANPAQDRALLDLLALYSGGVVYAYDQVLLRAPLEPADRPALRRLQRDAAQNDTALRRALVRKGGTPPSRAESAQVAQPPPGGRGSYLRYLIQAEEVMAGGWYQALQKLGDRKLIEGAAAQMAAGGRRLVPLRDLAGVPLLPRAFETGAS